MEIVTESQEILVRGPDQAAMIAEETSCRQGHVRDQAVEIVIPEDRIPDPMIKIMILEEGGNLSAVARKIQDRHRDRNRHPGQDLYRDQDLRLDRVQPAVMVLHAQVLKGLILASPRRPGYL
mmetsp:Transcript_67465/g.106790  ORF Transcript_67465/g.106790 Transcript_67465/m.106790 type:complete len:122 (+) Transcript_67465:2688-3053(+)